MTVHVRGLAELTRQLDRLNASLAAKALAGAARKAFKPVLEAAKALAPRDSGELADSIRLKVEKPRSGDAVVKVGLAIGKSTRAKQGAVAAAAFGQAQSGNVPAARRWHFIELGTSTQAAHPFLRPALDRSAVEVIELLKVELMKEIAKAVR